jgi:hypothetical protein
VLEVLLGLDSGWDGGSYTMPGFRPNFVAELLGIPFLFECSPMPDAGAVSPIYDILATSLSDTSHVWKLS